jgi:hypothetical protein
MVVLVSINKVEGRCKLYGTTSKKERLVGAILNTSSSHTRHKPIDPVSSSHSYPLGREHSCNHITLLFIIAARRARSGLLPAHAFS